MTNNFIQPLLTDFYQITMAYSYWKAGKSEDSSVFELYFRKNPFKGEYTIFAGLENCLLLLKNFKFSESDVEFVRHILPDSVEDEFYRYLSNLTTEKVILSSIPEGTVVFPKVPLLIVEGPLLVCQLLETGLLNLVNFASLVATNAARFRQAVGENKQLLEFGLRRAQGPDGGICASRNCYLGGFNGTSNVLAAKIFDIPIKGTHAHAYVSSFEKIEDITDPYLPVANTNTNEKIHFVKLCQEWLTKLCARDVLDVAEHQTKQGELTAFIGYAIAFPKQFLCLVDTYDVIRSGLPNFCAVCLALHDCGYRGLGIRIDSGDLAYLSQEVRSRFTIIANKFNIPWFKDLTIVASNDINEDTLHSLNQQMLGSIQGHSIDSFGIGTHLVTCQKQPALGCVYKLVKVNMRAPIKLSEDISKVTFPGRKRIFRFYGRDGLAIMDYMVRESEPAPKPETRILCRHPCDASKRAFVVPSKIEEIHSVYWNGKQNIDLPSLSDMRDYTFKSLATIRSDIKRALNPTPYKVSVSSELYDFIQEMWMESAPIGELY